MIEALDEHVTDYAPLVGVNRACTVFGVSARSWRYRRQRAAGRLPVKPPRPKRERRKHPASLTQVEKDHVVAVLCSDRFVDLAPAQVYATLLDEGTYLCSERGMYRILAERNLAGERRRGGHQNAGSYGVPRLEADGPNQCWSWDITKLRGPQPRHWYYLYSIIDIYSRKTVGWTVHNAENQETAHELIDTTCKREGINPKQLTLHADRGSPMIARSVAELLADLGVDKSHSRPRVSNDNPYIESHFKTLKYRPNYPDRFESITAARTWCQHFFTWYNTIHYHSGIGYLRPADLHEGNGELIRSRRQETLDTAQAAHPERFHKRPAPAIIPTKAWINRPSIQHD